MSAFKEGDTVTLKSGGPIMTIAKVGAGGGGKNCMCQWFDDKKNMQSAYFNEDTLQLADTKI